tara:strand:+ start:1357 stop:1653 length:297 start_codon:yes stop_codon:yes gene_type:complete
MKTIYQFEHDNNIYIGSTTDFKGRMQAHNQHKKQTRHNGIKFYRYLNENNITDCRPFVIKICEIDNDTLTKNELRTIEQQYLDDIKPNLNQIRAIKAQ